MQQIWTFQEEVSPFHWIFVMTFLSPAIVSSIILPIISSAITITLTRKRTVTIKTDFLIIPPTIDVICSLPTVKNTIQDKKETVHISFNSASMHEEKRMERSVGMILIIPFAICFILLFLVCCFADEMKKMCILPSQIPPSYRGSSPVFNTSRRQVAAAAHQNRIDHEDVEGQEFSIEQAETEQLISDELPIDMVVVNGIHSNNNNSSSNNNNNNNHQSDNGTSNSSSHSQQVQHSSYASGSRIGDNGEEEAETSLIPAVIRCSSLQRAQVQSAFPDILNHDIITSDLMSSRSAAAAAASKPRSNRHQVEVTVCVNNHFQSPDCHLNRLF